MLEGAIYYLLKKHFRSEAYYVDLLELFHDVSAANDLADDRQLSKLSSASSST
jgi:hypothetical protein